MLRNDQYALITVDKNDIVKRYPIDNMENTMSSLANYLTDQELDDDERLTAGYFLKNASALYGIDFPLEKQAYKTTNVVHKKPMEKKAKVPEYRVFALKGRYPLDTPQLVKQASQYLDEHWLHFTPGTRRIYAKNVQKQATLLNVETGRMIQKFASDCFSNRLTTELTQRSLISGDNSFNKLASHIGKTSVDEFATILTELDAKHKVRSSYGKSILDPLSAVLQDPMEKYAASGMIWDIDGIEYSEEEMQKGLAHPDVISLYGNSLVSQLRNPVVFDQLSSSDKKVILQYGSVR